METGAVHRPMCELDVEAALSLLAPSEQGGEESGNDGDDSILESRDVTIRSRRANWALSSVRSRLFLSWGLGAPKQGKSDLGTHHPGTHTKQTQDPGSDI